LARGLRERFLPRGHRPWKTERSAFRIGEKNDEAYDAYLEQHDPELAKRAARGLGEAVVRVAGEETRRKRDRARRKPGTR
jgi:hypothetical protein